MREGSKEAVAEAGAAVEGIWKMKFGGDADERPDLDGNVSRIPWTGVQKGITHTNEPHIAALSGPHQIPKPEPENPPISSLALSPPVNALHNSHRHD